MSQAAVELAFNALDHGIDSVATGGPLVPFTIIEGEPGERSLQRYVSETLEDGLAQARAALARELHTADRAALVFDGYVTRDGRRSDAVVVQVFERGAETGRALGQRCQPKERRRQAFETIGNPADLGPVESLI
jgi:hypothetical protein